MSHFNCVVILEDVDPQNENIQERVDRQLAPYMENCCAEPDKMYMKFYDVEDEHRKRYKRETERRVVVDDKLISPYDDRFKIEWKLGELPPNPSHKVPDGLQVREVPFKELYSDFDEFMEKYAGYRKDETYNRYGYWQNPNAKWDWYEIGGRWSGFFQLKKNLIGGVGKHYNHGDIEQCEPGGRADICCKNQVDFDAMRKECEEYAAKRYDAVWAVIGGTPPSLSWEEVVSDYPKDVVKAREVYHAQPRVIAFKILQKWEKDKDSIVGWNEGPEDYQATRDEYLTAARNSAAIPFAMIKDGKWIEKGDMGWWGMSSGDKDPETWNSIIQKIYDSLPGRALLVNCDCHI